MQSICVYCGSSDEVHPQYLKAAREVGVTLARHGITLVYGGGRTGLMGAVADGALEAGGEVIGVIPRMFYTPPLAHTGLSRLEVVADMHTRKARMMQLADALIALPGGYGTFEELFEALTWAQIGLHSKPIGLLNVQGYFSPLLEMIRRAAQEGFLYAEHQALFRHAESPEALLAALLAYTPPAGLERWVQRDAGSAT